MNWSVTSEYQTDHFTIERKYAGDPAFTAVVAVPTKAPGGTSTSPTNYSSGNILLLQMTMPVSFTWIKTPVPRGS